MHAAVRVQLRILIHMAALCPRQGADLLRQRRVAVPWGVGIPVQEHLQQHLPPLLVLKGRRTGGGKMLH